MWGTRGHTTSPRTCGPHRPPLRLLRGKGAGCRPSLVEEASQWTIHRRHASVFPLTILLCTNRFLPTPPRQRSLTSRSPPLQGNSAAMRRDWMEVSCSNLNGLAGNVNAKTSLGCRQSLKKGQLVSSPKPPPPLSRWFPLFRLRTHPRCRRDPPPLIPRCDGCRGGCRPRCCLMAVAGSGRGRRRRVAKAAAAAGGEQCRNGVWYVL